MPRGSAQRAGAAGSRPGMRGGSSPVSRSLKVQPDSQFMDSPRDFFVRQGSESEVVVYSLRRAFADTA